VWRDLGVTTHHSPSTANTLLLAATHPSIFFFFFKYEGALLIRQNERWVAPPERVTEAGDLVKV
jgi:hypothetical protein